MAAGNSTGFGLVEPDVVLAHLTSLPGALAVLALALGALWLFSGADDWAKLPGPPAASWLLGHLPQVNTPRVHRFFQDSTQRYGGSGMFRMRLLHKKFVVLSDPLLIQAVISRQADLPKAPDVYDTVDELFSPTGRRSMFNTHSYEEWKMVRKATAPAFSQDNIRKAFAPLMEVTDEVCGVLSARVAAGHAEVDATELGMRITLDMIGSVGFGYDFNARSYTECELFEVVPPLLAEFTLRGTNPARKPIHRLLPFLPAARAFRHNVKACHRWWDVLLASVRATDLAQADAQGDTSLRACLARMPVTDDVLRANAALYLIAGFETTAHSMAWALYEIAANEAVQERVAAELAAAGLLGPDARAVRYADLAELTFLNCVLKESMRLHPVASTGTVRCAVRDISLGGYHLSKGTTLWIPLITLLTSNANWERAEEFWPERWEQGPAKPADGGAAAGAAPSGLGPAPTAVGHASNPSKTYLPFSDGPRDCIGQQLAMMEARAVLASVVGRFQLSVAPRMGSREDVRASEVMKLTLQCKDGIHLRLAPRS